MVIRLHQSISQPPIEIPEPFYRIQKLVYRFACHPLFDWSIIGLIMINMVIIIVELTASKNASYKGGLKISNYVFCSIYIIECVLKVQTDRQTDRQTDSCNTVDDFVTQFYIH